MIMNKKFLTICLLMPACLIGCGENGGSDYLDAKSTIALLNSIKDYRANHKDDFKLDSKCTMHVVADTYLEEHTAGEHESLRPLGGDAIYRCDFDTNTFIVETDAFLNLGPLISGSERMTEVYFIDKNDQDKGIYVRGSETATEDEFMYWDFDLSAESGQELYMLEAKRNVVSEMIDQTFGTDQIDSYIEYIGGNYEDMHLLYRTSLAFTSTRSVSSGQGSLTIDITGFTRADTNGLDPVETEDGESFAFDTVVDAHIVIENYMTKSYKIEVVTGLTHDIIEDDDAVNLSIAGGVAKMSQIFEYSVGCEPIAIPDYSSFEYRGSWKS